jgi:hypothetical protein
VDQHIATQLPEARVAIRQYLLLSGPKGADIDELIDRMRAENTAQKRPVSQQLRELSVDEANQLITAATWQAWNVVEGPNARSDDPGDYYLDRFTAGLTASEMTRMREIERLAQGFQSFIASGLVPGAEALRALANSASTARSYLRCDLPIRYRPEMWVRDSSGLWRKRR